MNYISSSDTPSRNLSRRRRVLYGQGVVAGLVFIVIAVLWGVLFIKNWSTQRSDLATVHSAEQFSAAMRVLDREGPSPLTAPQQSSVAGSLRAQQPQALTVSAPQERRVSNPAPANLRKAEVPARARRSPKPRVQPRSAQSRPSPASKVPAPKPSPQRSSFFDQDLFADPIPSTASDTAQRTRPKSATQTSARPVPGQVPPALHSLRPPASSPVSPAAQTIDQMVPLDIEMGADFGADYRSPSQQKRA